MHYENDALQKVHTFQKSVIHLSRLHHKVCEKRLSQLEIHRSQHMMLMHLFKQEQMPSQKELAEHLEISTAAVAVALKKLETEGYIERNETESDNRVKEIALTLKGRQIVEDSKEIFEGIDSELAKGITAKELDACIQTLAKIEENAKALL